MESLVTSIVTGPPLAALDDVLRVIWDSEQRWGFLMMMGGFAVGVYGNAGGWRRITAAGVATVFLGALVSFSSTSEEGFGNALGRILPMISWIVLVIVGVLLTAHGIRSHRRLGVIALPVGVLILGLCLYTLVGAILGFGPFDDSFGGGDVPLLDG